MNIEANLFRAKKITTLCLYDNQSDRMFEEFLHLEDILPQCTQLIKQTRGEIELQNQLLEPQERRVQDTQSRPNRLPCFD